MLEIASGESLINSCAICGYMYMYMYVSVILNECLSQDDEAATAADDNDDADDDDDVIADTNNDAMLMNCFSAIVDTLAKTNPRFVN